MNALTAELARLDDIDVVFTDQPPPPPFGDLLTQGNVECVLAGVDTPHPHDTAIA